MITNSIYGFLIYKATQLDNEQLIFWSILATPMPNANIINKAYSGQILYKWTLI